MRVITTTNGTNRSWLSHWVPNWNPTIYGSHQERRTILTHRWSWLREFDLTRSLDVSSNISSVYRFDDDTFTQKQMNDIGAIVNSCRCWFNTNRMICIIKREVYDPLVKKLNQDDSERSSVCSDRSRHAIIDCHIIVDHSSIKPSIRQLIGSSLWSTIIWACVFPSKGVGKTFHSIESFCKGSSVRETKPERK